jgi:hypothetical protein
MRKFKISLFLLAVIISSNFQSCSKGDFSEEDAMKLQNQLYQSKQTFDDSLATTKVRVTYTITLVDAATSTLKSAKAAASITGATVKVTQNGVTTSQTCDASGITVFNNLKTGTAAVNVTLASYSEVNFVVNFAYNGTDGVSGGVEFANIIPMIATSSTSGATGTITGKVTCESNLLNITPEAVPAGTKIIATVQTNSAALSGITGGTIQSISYGNLSLSTSTLADGTYTLTVPATSMGLTYNLTVADFSVNQQLLMTTASGVPVYTAQSIPTNFGSVASVSASTIPNVNPVVVNITAPDYSFTPATAVAILDNSNGIDHINLTSNGGSYAPSQTFTIPINNQLAGSTTITNAATSPTSASFTTNTYGRITSISASGGTNYLPAAEGLNITIPYVQTEGVVTVTSVDAGTGAITGVNVTTPGAYYVNNPQVVYSSLNSGSGTSAQLTAVFGGFASGGYPLSGATITTPGTGYVVGQTFNVKCSLTQQATGTLHMTTGIVSAISITNEGAKYISTVGVDVTIGAPDILGGTQAVLGTPTFSNGRITGITVTTPGTGYTSVPVVTITNKVKTVQAKAIATVSTDGLGVITGLTLLTTGTTPSVPVNNNGYIVPPTVTIVPIATGIGTGADVKATVSGGAITGFTVVNGGTGYTGLNMGTTGAVTPTTVAGTNSTASTATTVTGSANNIVNINLGTGKRTIEK